MEWRTVVGGISLATFIFWIGVWCLHFMAIAYGKWRLYKTKELLPDAPRPGVSIIKPLTGTDKHLFGNLETYFSMKYPLYELLFCAHDDSEPALMVVRKLMNKYPSVDTKICLGKKVCVNPKINNMIPAYEMAKYDLILISDCGIRMKEDTLSDMVAHMEDDVGLVHQMPFVCDREGFAATLEKIYFGTVHARVYLSADLMRINCPTGMSSLMRKKVIDEAGGLVVFGCYLAEDFFMAKAITDRGWRLTIASQPAWQNSGHCKVLAFQARMTRWAKLRFAMVPHTLILEPLSECMFLGLLASYATNWLFEWSPLALFLTHILCWLILDWILLRTVQNGSVPFSKVDFIIGWLFREVYAPYLFLSALWEPTIRWRTGIYRLRWGGVAEEITDCKDVKS